MEKTEQEVLIEAKLQSMKAARRKIWITRWDAGEGLIRLAINNGRDGTYLVSRRFGREMFRRYVFDPSDQNGTKQKEGSGTAHHDQKHSGTDNTNTDNTKNKQP